MKKRTMLAGVFMTLSLFSFSQQVESMPSFSSDAEKAAWIKSHPQDYERLSGEKVTNSDRTEMTAEEKAAWIKANPEAYRAQGGNPEAVIVLEETKVKEIVVNPNDPTFPKFVMTGNPEQDAKDFETKKDAWYEMKKALWIEQNVQEYNKLNVNTPEKEVLTPEQKTEKYKSNI